MTHPVMCVLGRQDGVVPEETSRAIYEEVGSTRRELLALGTEEWPIGHADLFLAEHAEERIFTPIAEFLLAEVVR
jgi:esterase/lipase